MGNFQRDNDNSLVEELDSFLIASSKRRIVLARRRNPSKPYVVCVYFRRQFGEKVEESLVSYSEYVTELVARRDFETRRPNMRDGTQDYREGPMQKGKRLVQETMKEKLGE